MLRWDFLVVKLFGGHLRVFKQPLTYVSVSMLSKHIDFPQLDLGPIITLVPACGLSGVDKH